MLILKLLLAGVLQGTRRKKEEGEKKKKRRQDLCANINREVGVLPEEKRKWRGKGGKGELLHLRGRSKYIEEGRGKKRRESL